MPAPGSTHRRRRTSGPGCDQGPQALAAQAIDRLLSNALREQEAKSLIPVVAADAEATDIDPARMAEIADEVKRACAELRAGAPAHTTEMGCGGAGAWPPNVFVNVIGAWQGKPLARAARGGRFAQRA